MTTTTAATIATTPPIAPPMRVALDGLEVVDGGISSGTGANSGAKKIGMSCTTLPISIFFWVKLIEDVKLSNC